MGCSHIAFEYLNEVCGSISEILGLVAGALHPLATNPARAVRSVRKPHKVE